MKRFALTILAGTLCCGTALAAASVEERVRGEIISVGPSSFVVRTAGGADVVITLDKNTHYLQASRSSLDRVQPGSWIGTATKSVGSRQVALEIGIFPPELRGFGDGHGPWDRLPDWTASGTTPSMMTNGSVAAVAVPGGGVVQTSMTNGAVAASAPRGGAKQLTVAYKGGQLSVIVPPTAPIVAFHPGSAADLAKGVLVTVDDSRDGATRSANIVVAGMGGVRPPM